MIDRPSVIVASQTINVTVQVKYLVAGSFARGTALSVCLI